MQALSPLPIFAEFFALPLEKGNINVKMGLIHIFCFGDI